jgi:hypothetical protein
MNAGMQLPMGIIRRATRNVGNRNDASWPMSGVDAGAQSIERLQSNGKRYPAISLGTPAKITATVNFTYSDLI